MKVRELREMLLGFDPDATVFIGYDGAENTQAEILIEFKDDGRPAVCIADDRDHIA